MKTQTHSRNISVHYFGYFYKSAAFFLFWILFSFISCVEEVDVLPKLNTLEASSSNITTTTARLQGEILIVGNQNIIEYGIELSKSQIFSTSTSLSIQGVPPLGTFEVNFTGLDPNTLYYFKAYALINTARVYSQNTAHFTTKP